MKVLGDDFKQASGQLSIARDAQLRLRAMIVREVTMKRLGRWVSDASVCLKAEFQGGEAGGFVQLN